MEQLVHHLTVLERQLQRREKATVVEIIDRCIPSGSRPVVVEGLSLDQLRTRLSSRSRGAAARGAAHREQVRKFAGGVLSDGVQANQVGFLAAVELGLLAGSRPLALARFMPSRCAGG